MAALDFPASPSPNQQYTGPGGVIWTWDSAKWTNATPSLLSSALNDVGRNLLHNSMFNIQQRGVGPFATPITYNVDRWVGAFNLDTVTISPTTYSDAQRAVIGDEEALNVLVATVTGNAGAAAYTLLFQPIENVRRLANKTVTVSFWVNASAGTPKVGIGLRQYFGTGGSPSGAVDIPATPVTISTTQARYSATITLPSISGKTLGTNGDHYTRLGLYLSAGANTNAQAGGIGVQSGTFAFWGVQLEIGSVATPLEKRDPVMELQQCQRFYQTGVMVLTAYGGAGGNFGYFVNFSTTMRGSTPNVVLSGLVYTNASGATVPYAAPTGFTFNAVSTAAGATNAQGSYTASADL